MYESAVATFRHLRACKQHILTLIYPRKFSPADVLDSFLKAEEFDEARTVSQEQIVAILQQAEKGEQTIQAVCREHGITETTFYRWRKIYGGMTVSEAHRLKELEKENSRLKRLLAERDLEVDALKEYLAKK